MKRNRFLLLAVVATAALSSCQKELATDNSAMPVDLMGVAAKANQSAKENTFYGPQVQMGDGMARSYVRITHTGVPLELGVEMTAGSLSGLPSDHHEASFVLPLHQKARQLTPFEHIYLNWNEMGHPPLELFGVPHFDFHFYMTSAEERDAIPAYTPGSLHDVLPPAPYWPAGFVPTPGGEPQMGKHWVDIAHPVAPGTFTHTMIYGSYNGEMTFVEPMITLAYLLSGTNLTMPYGQPAQYAETGTWYPTVYNITHADGKHYVSLSNFVLR
jgi:hypothetical protein